MNLIPNSVLETNNKEELLEELKKAVKLRNQMGGDLYWNCLNEDCCKIANRGSELGIPRDTLSEILGLGTHC